MTKLELEQRRKRIETLIKLVAFGVVGFLVAPFIFIAIKGLVGLIVAGLIAWAAMFFTPVIALKFANWRLKAIKAEAARNPVETLQNEYSRRQGALEQFREKIKAFITERNVFADKLEGFQQQYPQDAAKFQTQLDKMDQLLLLRRKKYDQAKKGLEEYEMVIQKAQAIWEMGQAAAALNSAAGMTEDDFFAKIQVETALDSVQRSMNASFAELEASLLEEGSAEEKSNEPLLLQDVTPNILQQIPQREFVTIKSN